MNFPFSSFNNGIQHSVEIQKSKKQIDVEKFELIKEIEAHQSLITCLLYLKDKRIATGSQDASIKLYETRGFKCQLQIPAHLSGVTHLAETEKGYLVSCSCDCTLKLWEINFKCFRNIAVFCGHLRWVTSSVPLGLTTIVSGSEDQTVKVWDTPSHKPLKTIEFNGMVSGLHKLNNYNRIVVFTHDKTASFMDIEDDYKIIKKLPGVYAYLNNSFLETDDDKLIVGGFEQFNIIDLKTLKVIKTVEEKKLSYIGSLALINNNTLVLGCLSNFYQFNLDTFKCNGQKTEEHLTLVTSMIYYKDTYLVSSSKNCLKIWKVNK